MSQIARMKGMMMDQQSLVLYGGIRRLPEHGYTHFVAHDVKHPERLLRVVCVHADVKGRFDAEGKAFYDLLHEADLIICCHPAHVLTRLAWQGMWDVYSKVWGTHKGLTQLTYEGNHMHCIPYS